MKNLKFEAKASMLALSVCAAITLVGCGGGGSGGSSSSMGVHERQLEALFGDLPKMDLGGANGIRTKSSITYSHLSRSVAEAYSASIAADSETFELYDEDWSHADYDPINPATMGLGYSYVDATIYFDGNDSEVILTLEPVGRMVAFSEFDDIFPAVDGNIGKWELRGYFYASDNSAARFQKFQDELIRDVFGGNAAYCTGDNMMEWKCDYNDGVKHYTYEARDRNPAEPVDGDNFKFTVRVQ
jgi:hypothetical protein